jgi:hypothetical protein
MESLKKFDNENNLSKKFIYLTLFLALSSCTQTGIKENKPTLQSPDNSEWLNEDQNKFGNQFNNNPMILKQLRDDLLKEGVVHPVVFVDLKHPNEVNCNGIRVGNKTLSINHCFDLKTQRLNQKNIIGEKIQSRNISTGEVVRDSDEVDGVVYVQNNKIRNSFTRKDNYPDFLTEGKERYISFQSKPVPISKNQPFCNYKPIDPSEKVFYNNSMTPSKNFEDRPIGGATHWGSSGSSTFIKLTDGYCIDRIVQGQTTDGTKIGVSIVDGNFRAIIMKPN